ncbi:hypothetical protein H4R24_000264 [Coemansia sp. RSA 988]|nr:hypothetical protein H4R24_000264 [Coemansia sp. RSA 988]
MDPDGHCAGSSILQRRSDRQLHIAIKHRADTSGSSVGREHPPDFDAGMSTTTCGIQQYGILNGWKSSRASRIPLTSPTLLSPPSIRRRSRGTRQQPPTHDNGHRRALSAAAEGRWIGADKLPVQRSRLDLVLAPPRLSLDSLQATISGRNGGPAAERRATNVADVGRAGDASAPLLCDGKLGSPGRFSTSHQRGNSCPALDITRIMRSISTSSAGESRCASAESESSTGGHFNMLLRHQSAPADSLSRASMFRTTLSPLGSDDDAWGAAIAGTPKQETSGAHVELADHIAPLSLHSLDIGCRGAGNRNSDHSTCSTLNERQFSAMLGSGDSGSDGGETLPLARINTSGLRRRISTAQRDTQIPNVIIESEESLPLSPSPSEDTHSGSMRSSTYDNARWSATLADPSAHKHQQRRSAAIAETLRELEAKAGAAHSHHYSLDDSALITDACNSGESMTITLKGPRKGESDECDASDNVDAGNSSCCRRQTTASGGSSRSSVDTDHTRPTASAAGDVSIPAVYLEGSASMWDYYVAELESSDFDPNVNLKRRRVRQLLRVPWNVEKLLWFGVAICMDALLHVFSIMPARFIRASLKLAAGVVRDIALLLGDVLASTAVQTVLNALPAPWSRRAMSLGLRVQQYAGIIGGATSNSAQTAAAPFPGGGTMRRWLTPAQLFDMYRGLLLVFTCALLCRIDAAQLYHSIRAQSSLKLYFIFSALDIFDRLLSSFGYDALDALQSTVSDPWPQRWRSGVGYFAIAQGYMLVHTLVLFYQVITLNVAVNAYSDQLLSLLISNQFVEIKSNVFKKWEKEMLFQIGCADIVERFQQIVFLFIIILRNLAELSGTGLSPLLGLSPSATTTAGTSATVVPTAQSPVSFATATPSAFSPLIPSWMSMPIVNRILTPVLMVLGTELLIDWIKHAFVTKLNWIRPEIYSYYIDILSRDMACSRSGARTRVVSSAARPISEGATTSRISADVDEKIVRDGLVRNHQGSSSRSSSESSREQPTEGVPNRQLDSEGAAEGRPSLRSTSILSHVVMKVFRFMRANLATDLFGGIPADTPQSERGHRRTRSVTKPQLFVDQSSRVARRLGLAPQPLACMVILMLGQVSHILVPSSRPQHAALPPTAAGWTLLDIFAWAAIVLIAYALTVWAKLSFSSRLMQFAWNRYRAFERRATESGEGTSASAGNLKQFDDATKKQDRENFMEVGKIIAQEPSEVEWEQQRPKWTLDNIERYSLFKSRII